MREGTPALPGLAISMCGSRAESDWRCAEVRQYTLRTTTLSSAVAGWSCTAQEGLTHGSTGRERQ